MVFWCFPPTIKCEWSDLRHFVDHYNATHGKSYTRKACLDVEIRDRKAPELLLESPGETPIVIERKSVVWPPEYLSSHSNEHQLFQHVVRPLADAFRCGAYELTVRADYLKGKSKSVISNLAEQIIREVLSDSANARMRRGIRGSGLIPWSFRPLASEELDTSESLTGIRVSFTEPVKFDDPPEILEDSNEARAGYARKFESAAKGAAGKFEEYSECLGILLVQFHGDDSFLEDEDIIQVIKSAQLPDVVDQVWLAQHDWVSEDEHMVAWDRVR